MQEEVKKQIYTSDVSTFGGLSMDRRNQMCNQVLEVQKRKNGIRERKAGGKDFYLRVGNSMRPRIVGHGVSCKSRERIQEKFMFVSCEYSKC